MKMLSPDDKSILFYEDGVLVFRDLLTHQVNHAIDLSRYKLLMFHNYFSPDGRLLLITAYNTPPLLFDMATGELVQAIALPKHDWALCGEFAPDGETLFVAGLENTMYRWNWRTQTFVQQYYHERWGFNMFAVSQDMRFLVGGGGWSEAGIWDVAMGAKLHTLPSKHVSPQLGTVQMLPDGQHALLCEFTGGLIVHMASGQVVRELDALHENTLVDDAAVAAQANLLITNANDESVAAQLWDATTWQHLGLLTFDTPQKNMYPNRVDLTPDGRYAVTFPVVGTELCVWDVPNRALLRRCPAEYYFLEGG